MARKIIDIEVFSDVLCPWCYIGAARLKSALEDEKVKAYPLEFRIHYNPFLINPALTDKPMTRQEANDAKGVISDPEMTDAARARITREGEKEGLKFVWKEETTLRSTKDCHRVLEKVWKEKGWKKQVELSEMFYKGAHTDGLDVADTEIITKFVTEIGAMTEEECRAFLKSDEGNYELDKALQKNKHWGIEEVPFYTLVDEQWHVKGSSSKFEWLRVFEQINSVMS
ncbi:thioredoxin-like protein [Atractiella rhizophila]|nr:thioredoxin-like protein [Atractiella rhizophila]